MRRAHLVALLLTTSSVACRSAKSDPDIAESDSPGDTDTDPVEGDDTGDDDSADPGNPPTLSFESPAWARVGELLTLQLEAEDPDGDELSFSGEGLPAGVELDREAGILTWTPTADDVGVHEEITLSVGDGTWFTVAPLQIYVATDTLLPVALPAITDDPLLPGDPVPDGVSDTLRVSTSAGEHEPARLGLFASEEHEALTLSIPELEGPEGLLGPDAFDVRSVGFWWQAGHDHAITDTRTLVPELLLKDASLLRTTEDQHNEVRLADGSWVNTSTADDLSERLVVEVADFDIADAEDFVAVDVDAGSHAQLWLTLSVPEDQPPGVYTGHLTVLSGDSPVAWLPLEVEVLPLELPESDLTYSIYYRAELHADHPEGSISSEYKSADQLAAELRSMAAHGITNPTVYQDPDESELFEEVLAARATAGMDGQPVYLVRANAIRLGRSIDELKEDTLTAMEMAQDHGATEVFFMGRDEARGDDLTGQRDAWEAVREVGGKVWAAGYRSTAWLGEGNHALAGDVQDLLVCAYRPSAQEAALWHADGHEVFVYENPQGGLELPELNRRNFGLLLWQEDYDGAMTYAFQDSFGHAWNDFDHEDKRDFNYAYPTSDGVIDTLQYEGFREAVDDTRYLAALMDALEDADEGDAAPAQDWLDELKAAPLSRMDLDEVRDHLVGWTLHLRGQSVPGGPELSLDEVAVGPLSRDGSLVVEWTSTRRGTSQVLFSVDGAEELSTTEEQALVRHHRVRLTEVDPELPLEIRVRSVDADGNEQISEPLTVPTTTATALSLVSPTPADGATVPDEVTVAAELSGPWGASSFVDWDASLLAWWRFSEVSGDDAADSSSWAHTATMVGEAGERTDGWSGTGLWLAGDGDYADAGDLGVPEGGPATVEGWFNFDSLAVDHGAPIGLFQSVYIHPVNDHIYFRSTNEWFRSSSHLTPGAWHHLAISWEGDTSSARLWIDGEELLVNIQGDAQEIDALDDFTIGRSFGTLAGTVDELRVWDRALSAEEVRASYDLAAFGLSATFAGLPEGPAGFTVHAVSVHDEALSESRTLTVE